jgi:hypothetical protein
MAGVHARVQLHHRLGAGQQQGQRLFGHGRRVGANRRHDLDAALRSRCLSMVSVPLPCLEITLSEGAASMTAAPTLP